MALPEHITTRRVLLSGALAAVAGSALGCDSSDPSVPSASTPPPVPTRWPGHQPGQLYLGVSQDDPDPTGLENQVGGQLGLHRNFFDFWSIDFEAETIRRDHAAGRLPWVSFKAPVTAPGGWVTVATGAVDDQLRGRARTYAELEQPIVSTFHHEPSGDHTGTPEQFAAAYVHVHDVMHDETGLENVALVPVIGEWEFNPANPRAAPDRYLTDRVLERSAFLGLDVYQNPSGETYAQRLGRALNLLDAWGRSDLMIGIGETGCTDRYDESAAQWWTNSFTWATRHVGRVGAVSYFNSDRNSRSEAYWPLDENRSKLRAFAASVQSRYTCRLPA